MSVINSSFGGGGGIKINGIIEQYRVSAGKNINAGDFVQFVNDIGQETGLINQDEYSYNGSSAVKINENKIVVFHGGRFHGSELYATLITVNNMSFSVGTTTMICDEPYSGMNPRAVLVDTNTIFIAHNHEDYNRGYDLYGVLITINNSIITVGADTCIYDTGTAATKDVILIETNKVFVTRSDWGGDGLLCFVISTENNTIVTVAMEDMTSRSDSGRYTSSVLVGANKVFTVYMGGTTTYYLYGCISEIQETGISLGTETALTTGNGGYITPCAATLDDTVLMIRTDDVVARATFLTISGSTISVTSETPLSKDLYDLKLLPITSRRVFVIYSDEFSVAMLKCAVIDIDGKNVLFDYNSEMILSSTENSGADDNNTAVLLNGDRMIVLYLGTDSSFSHYGRVIEYNKVSIASASSPISGVAKTSGSGGKTINIYVPE